jgi:hypothetical protein
MLMSQLMWQSLAVWLMGRVRLRRFQLD